MKAHPSEEVNAALIRLNDALCTWERNTGQDTALIMRGPNYLHRSFCGKPAPECVSDADLLSLASGGEVQP